MFANCSWSSDFTDEASEVESEEDGPPSALQTLPRLLPQTTDNTGSPNVSGSDEDPDELTSDGTWMPVSVFSHILSLILQSPASLILRQGRPRRPRRSSKAPQTSSRHVS